MFGRSFADALGRKDFDGITALRHPEIDLRGLTPKDELEELVSTESNSVADRQRVSYRFVGGKEDGPFGVE